MSYNQTELNSTAADQQSFPHYGIPVEAVTVDGETGIWIHGQYGWYPNEKWGMIEYCHDYIISWKYIPKNTY